MLPKVRFSQTINVLTYDQTECDHMVDWLIVTSDRYRFERRIIIQHKDMLDKVNINKIKQYNLDLIL
jgi:hypothetical protein